MTHSIFRLAAVLLALLAVPGVAAAAGPLALPADARARLDAERPARVARAERDLAARRATLGLGPADALTPAASFTDEGGRVVVRLVHRHGGLRVLGSQAIAHLEPDGRVRTFTGGLAPGIVLPAGPLLSAADAVATALRRLGARGPLAAEPTVEQVIFPARRGVAFDPSSGRPPGPRGSYAAPAARVGPWLRAYRVQTRVRNAVDGASERAFVVDAATGAILRDDDLLMRVSPATGTGLGHYAGAVTLDTTLMDDGNYALVDHSRGTLPNPNLQYYVDDGSGWTPTGLQVWWEEHDAAGVTTWNTFLYQDNATNTWGDGQPFSAFGAEGGPNGQSAGVDVMVGLRATWDFFGRVLGRDGLDGKGTSTYGVALSSGYARPNETWWSIGGHGGYFGRGTWPTDPAGVDALTDLDVVAHEAVHGFTSPSFDHYWVNSAEFEEAGLNEATSDFFARMVTAWAARGASDPADAVPDVPDDAQIGRSFMRGTPLRWFDRPSKDGRSVDGWFQGLEYLDGHFSAGPLNRALHFLARGASASASAADHSVFLPAGMGGIGNDAAARIWYRSVTEYLVPDGTGGITYAAAREAALASATDLFGAGSGEVAAVENAFAAINVGLAHGGAPRVKVWFAPWRNGDWIELNHFTNYSNRQNLPRGEAVHPRITVENTPDTAVTWSLGGPSMYNGASYFVQAGGRIEPDGTWWTPFQMGWHAITATSVADPAQLAEGRAFLINMDHDSDLEQDATDMADLSFSWYLTNGLNPAHSVYIAPWVDDGDVAAFVDAMRSAWPAP